MDPLPVLLIAREEGTRENCFFYHVNDGFHYHKNNERLGTQYFKCVFYEKGCRGRAIFNPVDGFLHTGEHTLVDRCPDIHYADEMALRRNVLRRCEALEYVSFNRILAQESHW